jgi:DUF4097 and DUF4098 domain-containing protein YvlB
MTNNCVAALAAVAFAGLSAVGCVDISGEENLVREEKRFTVTGEPHLTIETFDGSIRVESWDRPEVLVEIEKRAFDQREAEALQVTASQDGDRIRLEATRQYSRVSVIGISRSPRIDFIVTAPRRMTVQARASDGSIRLRGLTGTFELRTGDGSVSLEDVSGSVTAQTGDGSVRVVDSDGEMSVRTGDGSIQVAGRLDGLSAHAGDGSVRVSATTGSTMTKDWNITTGDGSISLNLPSPFDANVDARANDGRVSTRRDDLSIEWREDRRQLTGKIGRGGRVLQLRSGDGSIDLR